MVKKYPVLAFKNLKKRGIRSWLTILGIFIGITLVIALISLGNALENAISEQFVGELSPDRITISGKGLAYGIGIGDFSDDDVDLINSIGGIREIIPRYMTFAEITFRGDSRGYPIANIPEESAKRNTLYQNYDFNAKEGRLLSGGETGVIIIGNRVKEGRGFRAEIEIGNNIEIQGENFRVVGIIEPTGNQMIDQVLFLPQDEMERLFGYDESYHSLDIIIRYSDEIDRISEEIRKELRDDRDQDPGEEDFEVQTALEAAENVNNILNTINVVVLGIALISLFVGGIGIMNTMYTSVLERRKEMGIMKSVGAENKDILYLFLTEASLLGLAGGIIGSIFGLSIAYLSASIANDLLPRVDFTIAISFPLIFGVILFSLLVGAISGILPAIQASRLNPIEALRK